MTKYQELGLSTTLIELDPEGIHVHSGELVERSKRVSRRTARARPILRDTVLIEQSTEVKAPDLNQEKADAVSTEVPSSYSKLGST